MSFNYSLMEPGGETAGNAIDIGGSNGGGFGGGWGSPAPAQEQQIERVRFESLTNVDELLQDEDSMLAAGLARDAAAVKECFKDLAGLVHEQGGMLSDIDQGVGSAAVHASKGTALVVSAREHHKKVRHRSWRARATLASLFTVARCAASPRAALTRAHLRTCTHAPTYCYLAITCRR